MKLVHTISEVRQIRQKHRMERWGLVPTMGYLHQGHLSLVERARQENDWVAATIFVNPSQFAEGEDLSSYPRDVEADLFKLQNAGADLIFIPSNEEMYPPGFQTMVTVNLITKNLEGASRPTHFGGVTTVVAKLFNIFQPNRAYFGQKDAQQTIVLKQLVADLNFDLDLIVCPTVREPDGLAMSSRNAYLNVEQRQAATVLYRALTAAKEAIETGERRGEQVRHLMQKTIEAEPLAKIDYVSVANGRSLQEVEQINGEILLSTAVFFDQTRLIDNIPLKLSEMED